MGDYSVLKCIWRRKIRGFFINESIFCDDVKTEDLTPELTDDLMKYAFDEGRIEEFMDWIRAQDDPTCRRWSEFLKGKLGSCPHLGIIPIGCLVILSPLIWVGQTIKDCVEYISTLPRRRALI